MIYCLRFRKRQSIAPEQINFDNTLTGGKNMLIYDSLNYLAEENEELGINPLSYVVLSCGR